MKKLSHVLIQPALGEWSAEGNAIVRDQSRALGYFIGTQLKERRFSSATFSGILFEGHLDISDKCAQETPKFLIVPIHLPESGFPFQGSAKEINEFLICHLQAGLANLETEYGQLTLLIREAIAKFREADYTCLWTHKAKKLPGQKSVIELQCSLDVLRFSLSVEIRTAKGVLYRQEILVTPPNEFSFKHRFKDILIEGEQCYITDFQNRKWASLPLQEPFNMRIYGT